MLLHDSRRDARIDTEGRLVILEEQDRSRWDQVRIEEGLELVQKALSMRRPGIYQLQAAIAAVHAEAASPEDTDWPQIAPLYQEIIPMSPSPVVALTPAVPLAMSQGPQPRLKQIKQVGTS